MNEKKPTTKHDPVHTITCGEILIKIHLRRSHSGFDYHDFTLERLWYNSTKKETHGISFFAKNRHDLITAVKAATAWIQEQSQPGSAESTAIPQ
jgi:hypothetical protein